MKCNVCRAALDKPIYSSDRQSITSLCGVLPVPTQVFLCRSCGHLQTPPLPDIQKYYGSGYDIHVHSDAEDDLYELVGDRKVFRSDHQVETLLKKVNLPAQSRVLDYGCAKGAVLRKLRALRPDLNLFLFDVSDRYVRFWQEFSRPDHWAIDELPSEWRGSFDLVTSFFVLEHVADPGSVVSRLASLLKPQGTLYLIVPNPYSNIADMIVVDHINHYSRRSLEQLLRRQGLSLVEVDSSSHARALIVRARMGSAEPSQPAEDKQAVELSEYWTGIVTRVRAFESAHPGPCAIYGAGFYGTFVSTCLKEFACWIDRNPHKQGARHLDKPVVAPESLDPAVRTVYVGLNPQIAKDAISSIPAWRDRHLTYFYL